MDPYREQSANAFDDRISTRELLRMLRHRASAQIARYHLQRIASYALAVGLGMIGASVVWAHLLAKLNANVDAANECQRTSHAIHATLASLAPRPTTATSMTTGQAAALIEEQERQRLAQTAAYRAADEPPKSVFAGVPGRIADAERAHNVLVSAAIRGADIEVEDLALSAGAARRVELAAKSGATGFAVQGLRGEWGPYRFTRIDPGSLFDLLGFRVGDVLLSVDGVDVDQLDIDRLSSIREAMVEYMRGGARHALRIHVRLVNEKLAALAK